MSNDDKERDRFEWAGGPITFLNDTPTHFMCGFKQATTAPCLLCDLGVPKKPLKPATPK